MNWADFYLVCFLFGFLFSVVTLVSGHLHLDGGHGNGHGHGHVDHVHAGHTHTGNAHALDHHGIETAEPNRGVTLSPFNMGTIAAFLAWFGGAGYLTNQLYELWLLAELGIAVGAGLAGAYAVFWFVSRVLMRDREDLDPDAYDMIGVLGTVTGSVRAGGIGEMTFSQEGLRRAAPVRSDDGSPIPTGVEVVVTRYSDGIAYVRRWDDLTAAQHN